MLRNTHGIVINFLGDKLQNITLWLVHTVHDEIFVDEIEINGVLYSGKQITLKRSKSILEYAERTVDIWQEIEQFYRNEKEYLNEP